MAEPALVARMELRIRDVEKAVAKVNRTVDAGMGAIEKRTQRGAQRVESSLAGAFKSFGAGFLGGIAAGGIGQLISRLGDVTRGVAEIGDAARRAGVSTDFLQEMQFVAGQTRISLDTMADGLRELTSRASEFANTGSGPAADALGRLGLSADILREKLKNPSDLFLEIIDRLSRLDQASRIELSEKIFGGTAGERFVSLLDQGSDGIRRMIGQAHDLGQVLDQEMIEKAQEIDRQFNLIASTVGTELKRAIVASTSALADFLDGWNKFENRGTSRLKADLADIGKQRLDIENEILRTEAHKRDSLISFGLDDKIAELRKADDELAAKEKEILDILNQRDPPVRKPMQGPPAPPKGSGDTGGGGTRHTAATAVKSEADGVRELIANLEEEYRLIGATDVERAKSIALRQAGAAATEEERQKIIAVIDATYAQADAVNAANEAMQEMADIGREALGGIIHDLVDGKSAAEAFSGALKRVGDRLLDSALDSLFNGGLGGGGGGGLLSLLLGGGAGGGGSHLLNKSGGGGGLLGGLFGGGGLISTLLGFLFHEGGKVGTTGAARRVPTQVFASAPRYHDGGIAGLKPGEVPAILQCGEVVLPKNMATKGDGGGVVFNFAPVINAPNADAAGLAKVQAELRQMKAEFEPKVIMAVRSANKRMVKLS